MKTFVRENGCLCLRQDGKTIALEKGSWRLLKMALSGAKLAHIHTRCTTRQRYWVYGEMILRWERYKRNNPSKSLSLLLQKAPEDIRIMVITGLIGPFQ